MGIVERIAGRRTYLDVNIFIYGLEAHREYVSLVMELFGAIDRGEVRAVTSELSLAEALVKPFAEQREDLQQVYMQAIAPRDSLDVSPVSREILNEAARTRAVQNLRLPDAIHLATARAGTCRVFLTNDFRIRTWEGIEIIQLSDLISSADSSS